MLMQRHVSSSAAVLSRITQSASGASVAPLPPGRMLFNAVPLSYTNLTHIMDLPALTLALLRDSGLLCG